MYCSEFLVFKSSNFFRSGKNQVSSYTIFKTLLSKCFAERAHQFRLIVFLVKVEIPIFYTKQLKV